MKLLDNVKHGGEVWKVASIPKNQKWIGIKRGGVYKNVLTTELIRACSDIVLKRKRGKRLRLHLIPAALPITENFWR